MSEGLATEDLTLTREELPEVLEPKHIQIFLGIGRRTTYEMLQNPPFHVVRIGRAIKISKVAFLGWLDGKDYSGLEQTFEQEM